MLHLENMKKVQDGRNQTMTQFLKIVMQYKGCTFFFNHLKTQIFQTDTLENCALSSSSLKVSTNEKRGGLKVVAFDRSHFKLFSLRFSKKSVEAPSFRRSKTNH